MDWLGFDPASALLSLDHSADALIVVSGYSIALTLAVFLLRRRDVAVRWFGWLFALFIAAWGTSRLFDLTLARGADSWHPGLFKTGTAALALATAIWLWCLLPKLLALPSAAELTRANTRLAEQIEQRDAALHALHLETKERMRTEAMLRQAQKMEGLGHLTGGVAHDFNNLLMVVQGNLEALSKQVAQDDPRYRYIARAMQGAARGAVLIQQLLAFARRQILRPVRFDVNERMTGLAELLRGSLGRSILLDWGLDAGGWPVEADPNQLETTLLNLAVNARDSMPDGGRLEIGADNVQIAAPMPTADGEMEPGDYVRIHVSDTGAGMTREVCDAAFEPFFTTKPIGQGTGLGLSQVYGFVKQSRGHIAVNSTPGRGTTVTIFLPRAPEEGP